ncbi:uncharacterized protein [Chanodichthys erythropterus]|uniref:uncharacterized protein isoform X2 n=1 Tax=Chanodichthys erythropterus TaxID=933992 RepID=UPI00351DFEFB
MSRTRVGYRKTAEKGIWRSRCEKGYVCPQQGQIPREMEDAPNRYPLEKNCSGRVFKEGSCDIIIKDLIFSDAGRYILRVYYTNDQRELKYHLHIHDEISVETGEQLKMDVLLINADKVERNSSGEWTEVWTRGHGVSSDRLTDRDGNLTISNFTVSDTGTYRVLDSEGEIWITVTVTITESVEKTNNPAQYTVDPLVIGLSLIGALLVLVVLLIVIWIYRRRHNNT